MLHLLVRIGIEVESMDTDRPILYLFGREYRHIHHYAKYVFIIYVKVIE